MYLNIGYVVIPAEESNHLRSGASAYGAAVVACLDPFLVVSEQTDMCWSTRKPEDFRPIAVAEPGIINAVQRRVPADKQIRVPYGESLLSNRLGCGLTLYHVRDRVLAIDLNRQSKVWPCMGGWSTSIAEEVNPSYGWVFKWHPEENLWRALHQLPKMQLDVFEVVAAQGLVHTSQGLGEFRTLG